MTQKVRMQPKVRCTDATTLKAPDSSTWCSVLLFLKLLNTLVDGNSPGAVVSSKRGFPIQHFCVRPDSIFPRDAHDLAKAVEVKIIEF